MSDHTKATHWNGQDLKGEWEFTIKVDGVRMLRNELGEPVSRANKPLYNLGGIPSYLTDCEIFLGSFKETISAVRSSTKEIYVPVKCAYSLSPLDPRLYVGKFTDPTVQTIKEQLAIVHSMGLEGLILRQGDKWKKVKGFVSEDVPIIEFYEQFDKHGNPKNTLGGVVTELGKVSTGFTKAERQEIWDNREKYRGKIIEAGAMQYTDEGKLRHPRFIRFRPDKEA